MTPLLLPSWLLGLSAFVIKVIVTITMTLATTMLMAVIVLGTVVVVMIMLMLMLIQPSLREATNREHAATGGG